MATHRLSLMRLCPLIEGNFVRNSGCLSALTLLLGLPISVGTCEAQTQTATPTLQQQFNAATDAAQAGDCKTAMPLFEALAKDPRVKPGSLPAAAIAVREGHCLLSAGRNDEGEALVEAGLPVMRAAGANYAGDVAGAEIELGNLASLRHDEALAIAHYRAALTLLTGDERITPLLDLAQVTAFDGGTEPLADADEALKLAMAKGQPDKKVLAYIHDIHARILMNQGQA